MSAAVSRKKSTRSGIVDKPVLVMGLLTLVGLVVGVWRLVVGLGSASNLTNAYPWGLWIAFDFSLIAFSGAGFTMAALVYVFHREEFRPALKPAILLAFLGYIAVLLLLVLDLGRWDRFYMFIIRGNVHSPLFEISWCVLLYSLVLFFENSPPMFEKLKKPKLAEWVHKYIMVFVVAAITLSTLHQSSLGTLYLNMPHRMRALWFSPLLSLFFFVSSIMAGFSAALLAYQVASKLRDTKIDAKIVHGLGRIVGWTTLFYIIIKLVDWMMAGELGALFGAGKYSLLTWIEWGLGAVVPMLLLLLPGISNKLSNINLAAMLVLLGVLVNRVNATLFAQIPPHGGSYTPHIAEWLSTIGIVAAAALAWYLGIKYVVYYKKS
jgi:Ni/Fe-hydrogenase subunit HybB-like protein